MTERSASKYSTADSSNVPVSKLPDEILQLITALLSNKDVKNVRLTNKRLRSNSTLHIERVFISPSYRNIEVLRAVAEHREYRGQVKEIIWDDARFRKYVAYDEEDDDPEGQAYGARSMEKYVEACEENLAWVGGDAAGLVRARTGAEVNGEEELMGLDENFALYHQFYEEQKEIIETGLDAEAFRAGLSAFSALERIMVTCEAHRLSVHAPRYLTPMIRSFPPSFNYPAPWPWCGEREQYNVIASWDEVRAQWRGFCIVLEELANCDRSVPELVIDVNGETTGIAYQFFQAESEDFTNFETICGRGLKRLDLPINVAQYRGTQGLSDLPTGLLKRALSKATSLEHFSIHSSAIMKNIYRNPSFAGCTDVLKVVPIEEWPNLRHLRLSSLPLKTHEFFLFLKSLPSTIKSLEFVDLNLVGETWAELLQKLKNDLQWTRHHPEITIANSQETPNQKIWIQEEVARYLDGGDNPFIGRFNGNIIQWGFGTVKDDFDDSIEEPWEPDRSMHVQVSPGVWEERKPAVSLDHSSL